MKCPKCGEEGMNRKYHAIEQFGGLSKDQYSLAISKKCKNFHEFYKRERVEMNKFKQLSHKMTVEYVQIYK
jgi:hypothetical protein